MMPLKVQRKSERKSRALETSKILSHSYIQFINSVFLSQALFLKTIENVETLYVEPLACAISIWTCT